MPVEHVDSYYAASANPAPDRPPLTGDVEADVCVVGGGIAGCATALFLAERGYQVVLLEGNRIAFGASGRSGGQAIVGYACSQDKLVAQVGAADARKMFDISVEALDLTREPDREARASTATCTGATCTRRSSRGRKRTCVRTRTNWSTSTATRRRAGSTGPNSARC